MSLETAPAGAAPSETAASESSQEDGAGDSPVQRGLRLLREHWAFAALFTAGAVLRVIVMVGYPSAMWFPDSMPYVLSAQELRPTVFRPIGYSLLLRVFQPFHSFLAVIALQHLLGLGIAVLVYALLRRLRVPAWSAAPATAPVLLDAFQVQVEHMIMSDAAFMSLVTGAVVLVVWHRRPGPRAVGAACLLLGLATIVRPIGLPLLAVFLVYVLIRRAGWRAAVAGALAGLLPLAAYATWYHAEHGRFALSNSSGIFLYARAQTFADCTKFTPPAGAERLCLQVPPERRRAAHWYIWSPQAPLRAAGGPPYFSAEQETLAGAFARAAIREQPGDYLATVWRETLIGLRWERRVFPDRHTYRHYIFDSGQRRFGNAKPGVLRRYDPRWNYIETVEPYSGHLGTYQRHVFLRGPLLAAVLLLGAVAVARRRRALGGPALLPWTCGALLVVLPPATLMFDYRYLLPAAPLACAAAALAIGGRWPEAARSRS